MFGHFSLSIHLELQCAHVFCDTMHYCALCYVVFVIAVLKMLLRHVTGSMVCRLKSVRVDFGEAEAIVAHTCASLIVLPKQSIFVDTEESFELFETAMMAVISCMSFNTV